MLSAMSYAADSRFVLFATTRDFIRAMQAAERVGLPHRVIAVPVHLRADCGMCLHIDAAEQERLEIVLRQIPIAYEIGL